jgi:hypothetical protein
MASTEGRKTFEVDGTFYAVASDTTSSLDNARRREAEVAADGGVYYKEVPEADSIQVSLLTLASHDYDALQAKDNCRCVLDYGNGTADVLDGAFVQLGDRSNARIACTVTGRGRRTT